MARPAPDEVAHVCRLFGVSRKVRDVKLATHSGKRLVSTKKLLAIVGATGLALGTAGIAAAMVLAHGSGTTTGTVKAAPKFIVAIHTYTGTVGPGGPGEHLTFAVTNTSSKTKEHVSTVSARVITVTGFVTSHGTKVTGCKSTWFTATVVKWKIASKGPTFTAKTTPVTYNIKDHTDIHITVLVTMSTTPTTTQSACAGYTPAVTLTVAK